MNWSAFWSGLLGTTLPGLLVSLLILHMTNRINKSMERHKKELEQNIIKFSKWHDKRLESLLQIYNAFCDYLDFLRRTLYVKNDGACMDPMHAFHRAIERQIVYLDDSMAEKVQSYQGELLVFWNRSMKNLSERGEEARDDIRHGLDYEIPAYLPRLRKDINEFLDPNYKCNGSIGRPVTTAGGFADSKDVPVVSEARTINGF